MLTTEQYMRAEVEYERTEAKRGFRIHALVYVLVNTGLVFLNAMLIAVTEADFPWALFPLVGWGIGLAFHYVAAVRHGDEKARKRQREIERSATRDGAG